MRSDPPLPFPNQQTNQPKVMKAKGKKNPSSTPGNALLRNQLKEKRAVRMQMRSREVLAAAPQKSVTEMNNLEEFFAEADLAGREFEVDREAKVFQVSEATGQLVQFGDEGEEEEDGVGEDGERDLLEDDGFSQCTMPRRPHWEPNSTSPEALDLMEKEAFLAWRRHIAKLEAQAERRGFVPSPFEKNLNFWRQLWRVMERSHVLVQVVDARNPLLFRFPDLEVYAKEISPLKRLMLIINKADLLPEQMREQWAEYFDLHGMSIVFFSAKSAQDVVDGLVEPHVVSDEALAKAARGRNSSLVVTREALLDRLQREANGAAEDLNLAQGVVGMVGYPNVGKSSVINALLGARHLDHSANRVSVSATPGHTKHFQTMNIENRVQLCDCPGLVFPSFFASKADMLCNGILPIDEIRGRDFMPAVDYVCKRIPKRVLEREYRMKILATDQQTYVINAQRVIDAFCLVRGLFAQGPGRIDESKGARLILKDYVCGKLLYCHPPPGSDDDERDAEHLASLQGQHELEAEEDLLVTEAMDLQNMLVFPVESEAEVLFEAEQELKTEYPDMLSRRLARHGKKHRKGRDKNPYDHESTVNFVAKTKGKNGIQGNDFTRKTGF